MKQFKYASALFICIYTFSPAIVRSMGYHTWSDEDAMIPGAIYAQSHEKSESGEYNHRFFSTEGQIWYFRDDEKERMLKKRGCHAPHVHCEMTFYDKDWNIVSQTMRLPSRFDNNMHKCEINHNGHELIRYEVSDYYLSDWLKKKFDPAGKPKAVKYHLANGTMWEPHARILFYDDKGELIYTDREYRSQWPGGTNSLDSDIKDRVKHAIDISLLPDAPEAPSQQPQRSANAGQAGAAPSQKQPWSMEKRITFGGAVCIGLVCAYYGMKRLNKLFFGDEASILEAATIQNK